MMRKKCKTLKLFFLSFCIGFSILGVIPANKAYADNTTNVTFEVVEPEQYDESSYEDIEGESVLMWKTGQNWVINRSTKSIITIFLPKENFSQLLLDNHELTRGQEYSVDGEYTTISLKKDYLNTLTEGRHDITVRFNGLNEEEESVFGTYLTIYTEESAITANIEIPNTGFFSAIEEIAISSLPVVTLLGIAIICIFIILKFQLSIKKTIIKGKKHIGSTFEMLFRRPTRRRFSKASEVIHNNKIPNNVLRVFTTVLVISAITGGFSVLFHYMSYRQSDAASTINLEVDTSAEIGNAIMHSDSISRASDTIQVNTDPGVEYDIYMSAGSDNSLRAAGSDKAFVENSNTFSLSDGSWGFTTEENDSVFYAVPKKGEETLIAHSTQPGGTKVYFVAKAGEGFTAGLYKGTIRYTVITKSTNPVNVTPGSGTASNTLFITTPIAKNGDMAIETPEVKIGEKECLSPNLQAPDNQYFTITCNIPENLTPGSYNIAINFPDIKQELVAENAYTEPEPTPDPEPEPEPTPDPEPDPAPEPEITYYIVSSGPSDPTYGATNRTSTSVASGTTFTSSGNTLTFSDGRTIVATPKTVIGYTTSCSGWTPTSGTVTSNITITANCTRTINNYTMTFKISDPSLGTISATSASIPYNTTYSSSNNTLSFANGTKVTVTPNNLIGYNVSCSGWSPSSGKISGDATFTATCTKKAEANTITYVSPNGQSKSYQESNHSIRALATFAGTRYSNVYNLNSTTYKNWTREGYYFDYWEGSDGNKYAPAAVDEGHNPYNQCTTCRSTYNSSSAGLVLTPHYTKMNNLNLAAITLAWPDGYTSNDTMVTSNKSEGWSHYVTLASPYNKKVERYTVSSTPEFKSNAAKYYTDANRRASLEGSNLASNVCDNFYSLGCNGSWASDDIGYYYARSCDRIAAIATYYAIEGLGNTTIKIPFGLPAQAKYFARGDQPWTATNTKNNSKTRTSSTGVATNMGRYETHYQPGDIRLVYRESSKHETYELNYNDKTYYLGHIAMYVKTEDGLSHIAEGGHSTYKKNSNDYSGVFLFANTAYTNGGSFDHLTPFYYKTTAQGYSKNEWYAIWRYNGDGN